MKYLPILAAFILASCVAPSNPATFQQLRDSKINELLAQGKVRKAYVPAIRSSTLVLGMNYYEAFFVWGAPDDTNTTVTKGGRREQCVYGGFRNGRYTKMRFLYFENGQLVTIQA